MTVDEFQGNQINERKATKRFFQNCRRFKKFTVTSVHDLSFLKTDHHRPAKTSKEKRRLQQLCAHSSEKTSGKQAEKQAEKRTAAKSTNKQARTENSSSTKKSSSPNKLTVAMRSVLTPAPHPEPTSCLSSVTREDSFLRNATNGDET